MLGRNSTEHAPLNSSDPMSSGNPYASQSPQGFNERPKKSRKKLWIIIGIIVAIIVILGAVLGGVLGSRASNDDSSSGSGNSADQANGGNGGGNGNAGVPSGVSNVNSEAVTATNANRYLAIATNSQWMLPVYPTGVSSNLHRTFTLKLMISDQHRWICRTDFVRFWRLVACRPITTVERLYPRSSSTWCAAVQVGCSYRWSDRQQPVL